MKKVYRILDHTDDDRYYLIGIFLDKEEALREVKEASEFNEPISIFTDSDYERIEIQESCEGWCSESTLIFAISREEIITEDGEYEWREMGTYDRSGEEATTKRD